MLNFDIHEIEIGFDLDKTVYFKMYEYSLRDVNESLGCDGGDVFLCEITLILIRNPFLSWLPKLLIKFQEEAVNPKKRNKAIRIWRETIFQCQRVHVMNNNIFQESTTSLHKESLVGVGNDDRIVTALYHIGVQNLTKSDGI